MEGLLFFTHIYLLPKKACFSTVVLWKTLSSYSHTPQPILWKELLQCYKDPKCSDRTGRVRSFEQVINPNSCVRIESGTVQNTQSSATKAKPTHGWDGVF